MYTYVLHTYYIHTTYILHTYIHTVACRYQNRSHHFIALVNCCWHGGELKAEEKTKTLLTITSEISLHMCMYVVLCSVM